MSRPDTCPPTLSLSPAVSADLGPARRLIVLIADAEADYTPAVGHVWELAKAQGGRVQFLGLCRDATEEPGLRRQLVTLSALVRDDEVSAEVRLEIGSKWVSALRSDLRAGDMIVCFAEQRVGLAHRPLSQILESSLNAPVYILPDFHPQEHPLSNRIRQTTAWLGSIGIILGFFWLQVKLDQLPKDWAHTVLLLLSIPLEIGLIVAWSNWFG